MTTIKLSKKTNETPMASKAPVRRADPAKRDRTKGPPPKTTAEVGVPEERPIQARCSYENGVHKTDSAHQRNHRFDGKLREETRNSSASVKLDKPNSSSLKPQGTDTRTTPRPDKNEPHYRQAPRRGGKLRDGYDASNEPQYDASAKSAYKSSPVDVGQPRLSKLMAIRGLCSRREADEWIVNGWVKVDGKIVDTLGTRVSPDIDIIISSYAHELQAENVTILLNKPIGYVSGQAEDGYEPAIVLIHPENQWEEDPTQKIFQRGFLKGLAPAGRLDIDSTGMLVLTQDGRVARHLIGEDSIVEKEYLVRVEGELSESGLRKLNHGLSLDGVQLKPAKVSWQNEDQLRFVLREGRKRQIRRMCELVGLHVVGLKRVRIGSVNLGKLPVGQWRYLTNFERF